MNAKLLIIQLYEKRNMYKNCLQLNDVDGEIESPTVRTQSTVVVMQSCKAFDAFKTDNICFQMLV